MSDQDKIKKTLEEIVDCYFNDKCAGSRELMIDADRLLPEPRVHKEVTKARIVDLPLGTRFKVPAWSKTQVYVLLEKWGDGKAAKYTTHDGPVAGQSIISIVEDERDLKDFEVEVVS